MKDSPSRWLRHAGMGVEFTASIGAFVALGWWVGRHLGWNPWATLVGAILGLVGAMYNLIRKALQLQREAESDRREHDVQNRGKQAGDRDRAE